MENNTKAVIANSDEGSDSLPTELLGDEDGYEIAGFPTDTARTAEQMKASLPDVVLANLTPSEADGLTLPKTVDILQAEERPRILMISGFANAPATAREQNPGTAYWISKLCEKALLASKMRENDESDADRSEGSTIENAQRKAVGLKRTIEEILSEIGISAQTEGYIYLQEAIFTAVAHTDSIHSVTKDLYPAVAREFLTTSCRVERAIRHAVEAAWDDGAPDTLHRLCGSALCHSKRKPTSPEFIGMIAGGLFSERKCIGL